MLSLATRKPSSRLSPKLLTPLLRHFPSPTPPNPNPKPFSSKAQPPSLIRGNCDPNSTIHDIEATPVSLPLCPGCGVRMQSTSPSLPGYFSHPSPKPPDYHAPFDRSHSLPLPSLPLPLKSGLLQLDSQENQEPKQPQPVVVCARCHSLRHYGRVKNPSAEALLPDLDFDRSVAPKMLSPSGPRSLVLLLVDASDFHGSFPKSLVRLLSISIDKNYTAWKEGKPGNVPRVLLVVTKCDVLPPSVSPQRLESWVRRQMHESGSFLKLAGVHLVSSVKDWGVRNLVESVREMVGSRGNVWAVGAQNAGKSTLINAMGRFGGCGEGRMGVLTEAPVPGTTIGIVRVEGVLSGQAKLFDTPGILHPHQITTRLTAEEQRLVIVGKGLRPRTYRVKVG